MSKYMLATVRDRDGNIGKVPIEVNDCTQLKKYPFLYKTLDCMLEEECNNNQINYDVSYAQFINEKKACSCVMTLCVYCNEEHMRYDESYECEIVHCKLCSNCHNNTENYLCTKCETCHNIFDPDELIFCINCTYNEGGCQFNSQYGTTCKQLIFNNKLLYFHKQCDEKLYLDTDLVEDYLELDLLDDPFSKENMTELYSKYAINK